MDIVSRVRNHVFGLVARANPEGDVFCGAGTAKTLVMLQESRLFAGALGRMAAVTRLPQPTGT